MHVDMAEYGIVQTGLKCENCNEFHPLHASGRGVAPQHAQPLLRS